MKGQAYTPPAPDDDLARRARESTMQLDRLGSGPAIRHRASTLVFGLLAILLVAACGSIGSSNVPPGSPTNSAASPTAAATVPPPVAAREAYLITPVGLVFDAAGNLYVSDCSDTSDSYIVRIDPGGMMTTIAGTSVADFAGDGGPATSAALHCPVGMAFAPDGALYFADHANNRIRRIDTAGTITTVAGSGRAGVNAGSFSGDGGPALAATLQEPWSVAFDQKGNLYIGDRDNYRVRRVDPNGVITTVIGTGKLGFSADGGPAMAATVCPLGVAVDPTGNVLFGDPCTNRVRKVDSHGVISTVAGTGDKGFAGDGGPARSAVLEEPGHLTFDGRGVLFVQSGLRVRRIHSDGKITTIVGIGKEGVPTDGMAALQAPFPELYGVAVDALGNVYVADGNTSVYRIDTKGTLTLFAGKH